MKKISINFTLILIFFCCLIISCINESKTPIEKSQSQKKEFVNKASDKQDSLSNVDSVIYGIDISKYQGNEVYTLVDSQLHFIICKATEGITYTDPEFLVNWKEITEKGYIKGAYHFYRCNDNYLDQANNYLKAISDLSASDLPPIVDFEETSIDKNQTVDQIQAMLMEFLQEIEKRTQRKPIIYTDLNIGNAYLNNKEFAAYPLWIANYTKAEKPMLPETWKNTGWMFWQKSGSYNINGTVNDFDEFKGSITDLKDFIKGNNIN